MQVIQPQAKKARLSPPAANGGEVTRLSSNLKVLLGGGGSSLSLACLRYHYFEVLKVRSSFIASNAKNNGKEKVMEVEFPLLDAGTWDKMIKFLDHPQQSMTLRDAISLAKPYSNYGFKEGHAMCEAQILRFFQCLPDHEKGLSLDTNLFVHTLLLCKDANLEAATEIGVQYMKKKLLKNDTDAYGSLMFTQKHIERLVPLIAEQVESDPEFRSQFPFKTKESIESSLFPGYFINYTIGNRAIQMVFDEGLSSITVSSSVKQRVEFDGVFVRSTDPSLGSSISFEKEAVVTWKNVSFKLLVERIDKRGWVVIAREHGTSKAAKKKERRRIVLWESPVSQTTIFPPRDCWKRVDPFARGTVSIEYNFGGCSV
mmetsp:Transcript_10416/g.28793  ORF Transcript_10416/g.28793 Transcript_10416/m.28793 type:complete len:371 (+) Transcript_10416:194-1306(+)|eukprot:CAMPEP_0168717896 /NCGR_PEP_ID=MMETSP0724-20121128/235_1 /TAXON_ID=265536 /ORGANISM="Amphiprora sp., Strain CCMP467" /LENGTH=370 /DNA_ID=CAMNT_0008764385 /DNA_START=150 /DNA_END=1262 /DNA_ORIENTATION=-